MLVVALGIPNEFENCEDDDDEEEEGVENVGVDGEKAEFIGRKG